MSLNIINTVTTRVFCDKTIGNRIISGPVRELYKDLNTEYTNASKSVQDTIRNPNLYPMTQYKKAVQAEKEALNNLKGFLEHFNLQMSDFLQK